MARDRRIFSDKFAKLHTKLGLPKAKVTKIIQKFESQYVTDSLNVDVIHVLDSAMYRKDIRSPEQYLYDLIDGWLLEDVMLLWLRKSLKGEAKVSMIGSDSDRVVKSKRVTADPDYQLIFNDGSVKNVELKTAEKLFNEINLKENNMLKGNLFLFYFIEENKHFLLDINNKKHTKGVPIRPNSRWGGKMCMAFSKSKIITDIGLNDMNTFNLGDK